MSPGTEIFIIIMLILVNGVFAMSEIAIVTSRKSRLEQWAKDGNQGAKAALALADNPNVFLATVQIGMTCTSILTGVFGGATIADRIAAVLSYIPELKPYAAAIGFATIVLIISYLTLIVGELTPKRIGLAHAERMACIVARPFWWLSTVAAPIIKLMNDTSHLIVSMMGIKDSTEPPVTSDEISLMLEHGTEAGVFQEAEEDMVKGVLRLSILSVTELMTPRPKLRWVDINNTHQELLSVFVASPPHRLLVADGNLDHLLGYVYTREVLAQPVFSAGIDLNACLKQPLYVPESMSALHVLDMFKHSGTHIAIVLDEYGDVKGVITMTDMLNAIVGDVDGQESPISAKLNANESCWLLDGFLPIEKMKDMVGIKSLPNEEDKIYHTLAGFVLNELGHVPVVGEEIEYEGLKFVVTLMKGKRIDRVGVARLEEEPPTDVEKKEGSTASR